MKIGNNTNTLYFFSPYLRNKRVCMIKTIREALRSLRKKRIAREVLSEFLKRYTKGK